MIRLLFDCQAKYNLWRLLFLFIAGCSDTSDLKNSPVDQIIEGPFTFSEEGADVYFDPPLEVLPHNMALKLLLGDRYELEDVTPDETYGFPYGYINKITREEIRPEVVLQTESGGRYNAEVVSVGHQKIPQGTFGLIGYFGQRGSGQFFYPEGTKIISAKIRANTTISVEYLYWSASSYNKAPERTWDDVKPSEVAHPQ